MATINGTSKGDFIGWGDGATNDADYIHGWAGNDQLYGNGGNDWIWGGTGTDALVGGEGNDLLWGEEDDDLLVGQEGDDTLIGGAGADALYGDYEDSGWGIDTASYADSPTGVTVNLATGQASGGHAQGDTFHTIENLEGSYHADHLTGDDGANQLVGSGGDDLLKGGGGADTLYGNADNDTLKGGGGADTLNGGNGGDTLNGGDNNDWLYGLGGNDTLRGDSGNDNLDGGAGRDDLYGGADADTFRWYSTSDTGVTVAAADVLWDFDRTTGDMINLSAVDADVYLPGNQAFTFIGTAAFSGTPGEIRYYHSGGDTYIEMQTGASVDVEGVIRLEGIHSPAASWFAL